MMGGSMIRRNPIRLDLTHRQFEALQLACESMRQNILAEFDQPHEYRYYDRYTVRTFNNLFLIFGLWRSRLNIFDLKIGCSTPKYSYGQVLKSVEVSFTSKTTKTTGSVIQWGGY